MKLQLLFKKTVKKYEYLNGNEQQQTVENYRMLTEEVKILWQLVSDFVLNLFKFNRFDEKFVRTQIVYIYKVYLIKYLIDFRSLINLKIFKKLLAVHFQVANWNTETNLWSSTLMPWNINVC